MKKIFIVDDHPVLREGLAQIINNENDLTDCGEAGDVTGSLEAIKKCKPDIVVVDLSLEDGSGLRLIENLMYYDSRLLILVYTMHHEDMYAERCLKAGAKGYLMKQKSTDHVISALREILNGELYMSDNLSDRYLNKYMKNKFEDFKSPVEILSNRELEVYQYIGNGLRKPAIAEQMHLSVKTVETYIENIRSKMGFKTFHDVIMHSVKFNRDNVL